MDKRRERELRKEMEASSIERIFDGKASPLFRRKKYIKYTITTLCNFLYVFLAWGLQVYCRKFDMGPFILAPDIMSLILCFMAFSSFMTLFHKWMPIASEMFSLFDLGCRLSIYWCAIGTIVFGLFNMFIMQLLMCIGTFGEDWYAMKVGFVFLLEGIGMMVLCVTFLFDYKRSETYEYSDEGLVRFLAGVLCFFLGLGVLIVTIMAVCPMPVNDSLF